MSKTKEKQDVRDQILNEMERGGRKLTWLAEQTGINYNTLHSCLKHKTFDLSEENLKKINNVLETDFE